MVRASRAAVAAILIAAGVLAFWYRCIIVPPTKVPFAASLGNVDFFAQILPMSARAADWLRHGVLPLWNPYQMAGHPFLATGLYGVLYPLNVPYLVLPTDVALEAVVALHMVLAGWFLWLYADAIGLRPVAGYAAAAAYVGSGLVVNHASWFTPALASSTWLPLALFAIERIVARRDGRSTMVLGLAIAMPLLGGWVQYWLYTMYAVALYAVARVLALASSPATRGTVPAVVLLVLAGGALGGALTAAQALPTRELQTLGPRRPGGLTPEQQLTFPSLAPSQLATEAIDRRLGAPYVSPFHLGPIMLALVVWSAVSSRGASRIAALWMLAIASFLTCVGLSTPFYAYVYLHLPGTTWFRIPQRAAFPLVCAATMLAAYGVDAVAAAEGKRRWLALAASLVVLAAAARTLGERPPLPRAELGLITLAAGGLLAATLVSSPRIRAWLATGLVLLIVTWSVRGTANLFRHPIHQPDALHRQDALLSYVRDHQGLERTFLAEPLIFHYGVMPKQGSLAGIYSITDYEPLSLVRFEELYGLMRRQPRIDTPFTGALDLDPDRPTAALLDTLSVRFVVTPPNSAVTRRLRGSDAWHRIPLPPVERGFELYEALRPVPRAYLATYVRPVPDRAASLAILAAPDFDPRTSVVVETSATDVRLGSSLLPAPIVPARITRYEPRAVDVEVDAPAPGTVVLTDTWYPGWSATVDGIRVEILPANHVLRGVPVSAGHHEIRFRYRPTTFALGVWISGVAALVMLGVALANPRW